MKANKNSIHAKLYKFTYSRGYFPNNLCPYFWKLIWATIIFIPNFILQIPALVIMIFSEKNKTDDCGKRRETGGMLYIVLILLLIVFLPQIELVKAMFDFYSYNYEIANAGLVIDILLLLCAAFWGMARINKLIKEKRTPQEEKKPSIVIDVVKAKYNKYCPQIDWE